MMFLLLAIYMLYFCGLFHFLGKLNVSSETIQHGVEGLTYLLTESSKLMVSGYTMCSI